MARQPIETAKVPPPAVDPKIDEATKKAHARTKSLIERLAGEDVPDSMKQFIVIQNLPDDVVDGLVKAWKNDGYARHGSAQWGEAKA